jgi:hypothetical protein
LHTESWETNIKCKVKKYFLWVFWHWLWLFCKI